MTVLTSHTFINRCALLLISLLSFALLTTTAGTNVCLFLLLLLTPWAWKHHQWLDGEWALVKPLFLWVTLYCLWDLIINLWGGHTLSESVIAMRHVRKFFFIVLFWPFFAVAGHSRVAILTLGCTVIMLAVANLFWSILLGHDGLMISHMPNMHGQILVGISLLLIHSATHSHKYAKQMWFATAILLSSLFFASTRRTGYVLLFVGGALLFILLYLEQPKQRKKHILWIGVCVVLALFCFAALSPKVHERTLLVFSEYEEFFRMSPRERSQLETSVGLRLQYVVSSLKIVGDHIWFGVGSITFKPLFWEINQAMGATNPLIFAPNPHNEYLYVWATKGLLGMGLYLAIFIQACLIASKRKSTWQRHGMWIFVCLFLVSIFFNSMSIDMVEGHFMMLVFLCFLAPQNLGVSTSSEEKKTSAC